MRSSVIVAKLATRAVSRLNLQASQSGRLTPTVLCYHRVLPACAKSRQAVEYSVTPKQFTEQMALLNDEGFISLSLQEYYEAALGRRELPERAVLATFDDGYADNYLQAWPIAERFGITLNLFICTGLVTGETPDAFARFSVAAESSRKEFPQLWKPLSWNQLREMAAAGVGIGFHSHSHKNLGNLPASEIERDSSRGLGIFNQHLEVTTRFFAFPFGHFGSYSREAVDILRGNGIEMFFSTELGRTPMGNADRMFSRIVIHPEDDLDTFRRKLYGGYDWVGRIRRRAYQVRSALRITANRLSRA